MLSPDDGISALERLIGTEGCQVVVLRVRWDEVVNNWPTGVSTLLEELARHKPIAAEEEAAAAEKLKEQQARLVRGRQGRGGLLFGSELGVQDGTEDKATTLGG